MAIANDFREWQLDGWADRLFLRNVPAFARKECLRAVRPLSAESSARVFESLFAGIKHPFHYVRANGWMGRLLRADFALPDKVSFEKRASYMGEKIGWPMGDIVLLVCQSNVYATRWESFLHYFGFINLDTMLVCHPKARETILFWEECGPKFGKRGHRELPCPSWSTT